VSRFLVTLGIVLVVAGLAWPLLSKLGLGRLPGDIHVERGGFTFWFPITTGLVVSAVISLILWLLRR
jgi:ribose/xylose/arabinose/galactoside ABC-type transport system permease subunit